MGPHVVASLHTMGHQVAVCNRGQTEAALPAAVERLRLSSASLDDRDGFEDLAEEFRRFAPDVVVDMIPVTERAAQATMQAFRGIAGRVVALSSQDVYRAYGRVQGSESGPPDPVPLTEKSPLRERLYPYRGKTPRALDDPYRWMDDYDKIPVEQVILGDPELPGTVLRLPMVYGLRDRQHRTFEYLKRMDDGRLYILLGEGLARWRWTRGYAADMAHAITLAVIDEGVSGRVYNVGEPEALSMMEWVKEIAQAAGWQGEVIVMPDEALPEGLRSGMDTRQNLVADTSRIRYELGYAELSSREETLRRTVAWQRVNPPETIDPSAFDYQAEEAALQAFRGNG
jgi:nucleoside-diphosphate-sugar epimerase